MKKIIVLLLFMLPAVAHLAARPARITVAGVDTGMIFPETTTNRGIYPQKGEDDLVFIIPEEVCGMLYLVTPLQTTWLRALPGCEIVASVTSDGCRFSGDGVQINDYLFGWTQDMFNGRPSEMSFFYHVMMRTIPERLAKRAEAEMFFTPEYMVWIAGLKDLALAELDAAELDDPAFVASQRDRILFTWLDIQARNYSTMVMERKQAQPYPGLASYRFGDASLIDYLGCDKILDGFFTMYRKEELPKSASLSETLATEVAMIASPVIKEYYILKMLREITGTHKNTYRAAEIFDAAQGIVSSGKGRHELAELHEKYLKLLDEPTNRDGKPAYPFEFETLNGETVRLADFVGKYLFIDVWATWCGPCKFQIPFLTDLEREFEGRNIKFLSISVDKPADRQKWADMIVEQGMGGLHAISPDALNYEMFREYGISGIPRFMLISPDGMVVMTHARRPSDTLLKMQLLELLDAE